MADVIGLLGCSDVYGGWMLAVAVFGEAEWAIEIGMHNFISKAKQFIKQYCLHFNYYNKRIRI